MTMGHCKHGEFILTEGCPQCIAEAAAELAAETEPVPVPIIVKVRYLSDSAVPASEREYSYFSAEVLKVGDVVQVPVRDRVQKAVVTAIDVPESEIADFRFDVKTIPAGSIFPGQQAPTLFDQVPPEEAAAAEVEPPEEATNYGPGGKGSNTYGPAPVGLAAAAELAGAEVTEAKFGYHRYNQQGKPAALVMIETHIGKPAPELLQLYLNAAGLLQFAKDRIIATNEDLKPATDDLATIAVCKKAMFARKTELVGPLKAKLDMVNQAFDDIMFPVLEADRLTRGQVSEFDNKQRRTAAEAKRIEDEKLKLAQAEMKLTGEHTQELGTAVAPPAVPEHTRTELGTLGGRANWKARVVDFKLLDDQWKIANESLLNNHARTTKGERPIPGVEFYDDHVVTMRTR